MCWVAGHRLLSQRSRSHANQPRGSRVPKFAPPHNQQPQSHGHHLDTRARAAQFARDERRSALLRSAGATATTPAATSNGGKSSSVAADSSTNDATNIPAESTLDMRTPSVHVVNAQAKSKLPPAVPARKRTRSASASARNRKNVAASKKENKENDRSNANKSKEPKVRNALV